VTHLRLTAADGRGPPQVMVSRGCPRPPARRVPSGTTAVTAVRTTARPPWTAQFTEGIHGPLSTRWRRRRAGLTTWPQTRCPRSPAVRR